MQFMHMCGINLFITRPLGGRGFLISPLQSGEGVLKKIFISNFFEPSLNLKLNGQRSPKFL